MHTFSTNAFTPILHSWSVSSPQMALQILTHLKVAKVAKPFSTGSGVLVGSCDDSRGAMM